MMHRVVVPKLSSMHRFACLALYRALLRQCNQISSSASQLNAAQAHIRDRFRRYKDLESPSQTANALKAGYEGLDLLHSAVEGNKSDAELIQSILSEASAIKERKRSMQNALTESLPVKQPTKKQLKAQKNKQFQNMTAKRHPDAVPILTRPRGVVNGRRRVPAFINAHGVPFLLFKKPQPQNLSRVIRQKLDHRWSLIERRERLRVDRYFAEDEDEWDRLTSGTEKGNWSDAARISFYETHAYIQAVDEKRTELAQSMWNVVLAERELAKKENLAAEGRTRDQQTFQDAQKGRRSTQK
ncbi:hypothetical protein BJX64DRAFT_89304 [Aspergillus heterothallicus]